MGLTGAMCIHPNQVTVLNQCFGASEADMYAPVRLTILGRSCTMDVIEVPDTMPALIGKLPLKHLDFLVDPQGRTLVGNPAHGGEHMLELY